MYLLINQLWSISSTTLQTRIKLQLSMILFGKTLVKKDLASSAREEDKEKPEGESKDKVEAKANDDKSEDEEDVSSKSQIIVSRRRLKEATLILGARPCSPSTPTASPILSSTSSPWWMGRSKSSSRRGSCTNCSACLPCGVCWRASVSLRRKYAFER